MPQIGFIKECKCPTEFKHPDGTGKEVDCVGLEHYLNKSCHPTVPHLEAMVLVKNIMKSRYGQSKPVVSVTMLEKCPRTLYYETHKPWVGRLLDTAFMLRGTFAHEGFLGDLKADPDWIVEVPRVFGVITPYGPVSVYGTPDAYHKTPCKLLDLKTQQQFAVEKKLKASDAELYTDRWVKQNIAQVNCYRVMLEDAGMKVASAELHYMDGMWKSSTGKCRIRVLPVPLVPVVQVIKYIESRAGVIQVALEGTVDPMTLPIKEHTGWKPKTGVDYLLKQAAITATYQGELEESCA